MKAAVYLTTADVQYQGRTVRALVPGDRWSAARLAAVKVGRMILCWTHAARNGKQHRLLWALATLIAENTERFQDAEHVVDQFKFVTGHVVRRRYFVPEIGMIEQLAPKSIAYESMSQGEFEIWFAKVLDYVQAEIWPGIGNEIVRAEVAVMLGFDDARRIGHNSRRAA